MKKKTKIIIISTLSVLLICILGVMGGLYYMGMSGIHHHSEPQEGQIKVACVGDSITYGHGISNWKNNSYPACLDELLGDGYHVENFGVSGTTLSYTGDSPYVETSEYEKSLEYGADILVLMLGTNDSKPQNFKGTDSFVSDLDRLLAAYRKSNPDIKIYLCTPPAAFFPDGVSSGTTNYDIQPTAVEQLRYCVTGYAVSHLLEIENIIDVYDLTSEHPEWFEVDLVHPSNEGAAGIAELVAKKLLR